MASPRQDLDSILDAALDQLASDSDNDEPPPTLPLNETTDDAAVPKNGGNPSPSKPAFGPPPPTLTAEEAELAASLEGMMKQFMAFEENEEAERAMQEMLRMMGMPEEGEASRKDRPAVPAPSVTPSQSEECKAEKRNKNKTKSSQDATQSKTNSTNKQCKTKTKSPDMNDTISTLLHNIQQPSKQSHLDPTTLTDTSISTLLSDLTNLTSSPDASPLLDTVMSQLLAKDLMYPPMKQVCTLFPEFLAKNQDSLSVEEYERYGKQYQYFQRICRVYEVEEGNFDRLMELMQDIQEWVFYIGCYWNECCEFELYCLS